MATIKRSHTFYDDLGTTWTVEIHDDTYASTASDMKLESPGFEISWKGEGDTRFEPVKASEARIYFVVENSTDLALLNSIIGANEERYGIVIKKGSDMYWAGHILTDLINIEDAPYPFTVELTATDGIGRLADVDFDDAGTPYSGVQTFVETLIEIIDKTGISKYWGASDPILSTVVNWYDVLHPTPSATIDPMSFSRADTTWMLETEIDEGGYLTLKLDENNEPVVLSALQVITELCKTWGARFCLSDGLFRFTQVNETAGASITYRRYDKSGAATSTGTYNPRATVDQSSIAKLATGTDSFFQPLSKVRAVRKHASGINLLAQEILGDDDDLSVTSYGLVNDGAGNYLELKGTVRYKYDDGTSPVNWYHYCFVKITVVVDGGATVYYLNGSNSTVQYSTNYNMQQASPAWTTTNAPFYFWKPTPNYQSADTIYIPWSITTPAIPIDGTLYIGVEFVTDPVSNNYGGTPLNQTWKHSGLSCFYIVGNYSNGTVIEVINTTDGTTPTQDTTEYDSGLMLLGDGVTTQSLGAIEVLDAAIGGSWANSTSWKIGGSGTGYSMTELLCREILAGQKTPVRKMQCEIYGAIELWNALSYGGAVYVVNGATFSAVSRTWSGEWFLAGVDRTLLYTAANDLIVEDNGGGVNNVPPPAMQSIANMGGLSAVTSATLGVKGLATTSARISGTDAITSIDTDLISSAIIYDGDVLVLIDPITGASQEFTVDGDVAADATSIAIDSAIPDYDFPANSYLMRKAKDDAVSMTLNTLRVGDIAGGNYMQVESDGTIVFYGDATQFDDVLVTVYNVRLAASQEPSWVDYKSGQLLSFSKSATNKVYFTVQAPHGAKIGGLVDMHIHTVFPDANSGNVYWEFTWSRAAINDNFPAATSVNVTQAASGVTDKHDIEQLDDTTCAGISEVYICSLARLGGNEADTYDNVVYLAYIDFHFEKDTLGSRSEYSK